LKALTGLAALYLPLIEVLQSDNGTEFKNKLFTKFAEQWNFKIVHPKARNPQADGLIEQVNGQMQRILEKIMDERKTQDWPSLLDEVTGITLRSSVC
jgi:transposase InsO family protein